MASDPRRHRIDASSSSRNRSLGVGLIGATNVLNTRCFLLEIDNRKDRERVEMAIRKNGGEIIETFHENRTPIAVVSDHSLAIKIEKKMIDLENERALKAFPALLREAVKRKIRVRTVDTFLKQLGDIAIKSKHASSATNSTDTRKTRAPVTRLLEQPHFQKKTFDDKNNRISSTGMPPKPSHRRSSASDAKAYVRIDVPNRRPDVRSCDKNAFRQFYGGNDAGFSVFRRAEASLVHRRFNDFDRFVNGNFEAVKKTQFKLEDEETYCQFCGANVNNMEEHERTDAHRNKVKHQGIINELDRVVMTTRLAIQISSRRSKRKLDELKPDPYDKQYRDYQYGENEFHVKWEDFSQNEEVIDFTNQPHKPTLATSSSFYPNDLDILQFIGHA